MLDAGDLAEMAADIADLISDHAVTIQLRRRQDTLPDMHTVRIERKGLLAVKTSPETERTVTRYVAVCEEVIDVQNGDRFNAYGFLFEVAGVSPRQVGIQFDTYMVQ
jgi:hypothetical protein